MQKLSRRDEAVGMLGGEDDGINDPNHHFALLYRKSRLQMKLWDLQKQAENSYSHEYITQGLAPIRAAIDALDVELLKNFVPLLQRKIVEETETGVLLTLSAEERAAPAVRWASRRPAAGGPRPANV